MKKRYIIHIDMDAFFAAIEQRDNPAYRGKPVIIGADPKGGKGRGVVSTASYEARKYGVHSAMPISVAYRKCPDGVFLGVDMEKYMHESEKIFTILDSFTPAVERVSVDEAFLDISGMYKKFGSPQRMCMAIKKSIRDQTGLTASIGLAPTKMAAKIASGLKKPDGFVEVKEDELLDFLRPLRVDQLWGIGKKTTAILNSMNIFTIGDIAKRPKEELISAFGKNGEWFWQMAHGIDENEVSTEHEVKSISNETTFETDVADRNVIEKELSYLSESVALRLRESGFKCRTITLKIRFENFETHTKQTTANKPVYLDGELIEETKKLFNEVDTNKRKVRLVGVRASGLVTGQTEKTLFDMPKLYVQNAVDRIRAKFGKDSIYRASSK